MAKEREPSAVVIKESQLPSLVQDAQSGDKQALDDIVCYLRLRLLPYFAKRPPNDAEDLTQESLSKIIQGLPNFDLNYGPGNHIQNFRGWVFTIVRNTYLDKLREQRRSDHYSYLDKQLPEQAGQALLPIDLISQFKRKLAGILPARQLQFVNLRLEGKTNAEIAAELGLHENSVAVKLVSARRQIEGKFILPAGFKRVSSFGDKALSRAAFDGRLEAVKFLGLQYTTTEAVNRYQVRKRTIQTLLDQGFLPLSSHTSSAEYRALQQSTHRQLIVVHQGRLYISPENLTEFRRIHKKAKLSRTTPPGPGYQRLTAFSRTKAEYNILLEAARKDQLLAVRQGHYWFTTQEAVDQLRNSKIQV